MRFGRYYEEFVVGEVYDHPPATLITADMNNAFCALTRNEHPLHTDSEYAATTEFGNIVVPGTLVLSLVVGLSVPEVSGKAIANLGFDFIVHAAPVFVGDKIRAVSSVKEKRLSKSRPGQGIVKVITLATKGGYETVIMFQRSILVPCRGW